MKINPVAPQVLLKNYSSNKTQMVQQVSTQKMDQVEFSGGAQSFADAVRSVKEAMQAESSGDAKRIGDLRKQIQDGTYQVSGREVAEKMIKDLF